MKRLIFRLSSLGDLILAQSALEPPFDGETHWVVAKEFAALVQGNPKIKRVWAFDRRAQGDLGSWRKLLGELYAEGFDEVIDLHSTLRTRFARLYFFTRFFAHAIAAKRTANAAGDAIVSGQQTKVSPERAPQWRSLRKERGRRLGYFLFKRFWPRFFRPRHLAWKSARLVNGTGSERPNLRWLLSSSSSQNATVSTGDFSHRGSSGDLRERSRFAVVPSSAWRGKEWPAEKYLALLESLQKQFPEMVPVLFGLATDRAAARVRDGLRAKEIPFEDRIGRLSLPEVARELTRCRLAIGPDTGLLHLAEAVGTPVLAIFGPTRDDFGFGPSDPRSVAIHGPVGCSPCSKDGSLCYRFGERYACLTRQPVTAVLSLAAEKIRELR